ncbi:MAG: hypothetical protein V4542_04855 [Pseudomonadota bacterium]
MKKGLAAALTGTFLLVALLLLGGFNLAKPRILVLHSADRNTPSAIRVNDGIRGVLDKNRQPLSLRWHYLAIDSLPDEAHREDAGKEGQRAVEQFNPDVILAVDDEAQQYVASRYAGKARPKIVFAAIDREPAAYGYAGAANVTGVSEVLPLAAIRETLLLLRQQKPARVAVIGNTSPTGKGELRQVQAFDWAPHTLVELQSPADFASWQAAVKGLDGRADVLLVLAHDGLKAGPASRDIVAGTTVVRWIEAHSKPLPVGIRAEFVERGGGLGIGPSSRAMGEAAATMTMTWLKSASASAPPLADGTHYSVAVRDAPLRARNVSLPSVYIEAARLNNLYFPQIPEPVNKAAP